jgi:sorbose reductase
MECSIGSKNYITIMTQSTSPSAGVLSRFSLKGKIAVVTGGARGIGLEVVRGLAEAGADVALIYSSSKQAPQVAADIAKETGVRVQAFQSDVSSRKAIFDTINDIATNFGNGPLDIVVANSGVRFQLLKTSSRNIC